jgi:L-threonylcarbamoyladenylate synthase
MEITLHEAADIIKSGKVIAVPTETVYGLAASLFKPLAIDNIFQLKGRPANNPLIIHVAELSQIYPFLLDEIEDFIDLANGFWPGPLTIVMPINVEVISNRVIAGLTTAAFRVPKHEIALELLRITGPLVMPSANISGKPSATSKEHVEADFGMDFPVLNGGSCERGLESTIVYKDREVNKWKIIRQGAISANDFAEVLRYCPEIEKPKSHEKPICPGQLYRHYAPKAKLILTREINNPFREIIDCVIVGFYGVVYPVGYKVYFLGSINCPEIISQNLYNILRRLDDDGVALAYVDINIPETGLYATILERLYKASGDT